MKWQGKHGRRREGKEKGETELSEAKVTGKGNAEEVINFVSCFYSRVPSTLIKLLLLLSSGAFWQAPISMRSNLEKRPLVYRRMRIKIKRGNHKWRVRNGPLR